MLNLTYNTQPKFCYMKTALLISEASVYTNRQGKIMVRGGGEMFFHNLAKALLLLGIKPVVFAITEFPEQKEEETIEGVFYKRFPVSSRSSLRIFSYLKAGLKKSKGYDFVFFNQFTPHLVLPWIKARKIAVIHDVYQHRGGRFWRGQYGNGVGTLGNLVEKFQLFFDRKYADKILTVSESSEVKILDFMGDRVAGRLVRAFNPVMPLQASVSEPLERDNIALFVGRFVDYKNPEHVLLCLKKIKEKYSDFKAVFVVPRVFPKVLSSFQNVARNFGFSDKDIELRIDSSAEEVGELYRKAKILIHPSYVEGQGIVILEALANGVPVVAYDLDAYKGMIKDEFNGLLVPKGDIDQFILKSLQLLDGQKIFSENAKESLQKFSEENFLGKLSEVLI